jgi:GR25 family glycosyltransferase involved in LPS biosynthesis
MDLENIFIRYINLDRRTDRNEDVKKKFVDILGFNFEKIQRFSAIDGINIIDELRHKNYVNDEIIKTLQTKNLIVKSAELGCMLSHYFLLKQIMTDETIPEDSLVFIFEDDFFINSEYLKLTKLNDIIDKLNVSKINNENNWDMIYFGGRFNVNFYPSKSNIKNFFTHSFDNFYLRVNGFGLDWDRTTCNYLVKKKNIKKILDCILDHYINTNKIIIQIDSLYNSLSKKLFMYDYFPHLFYSPLNYSTDIQKSMIKINTSNIN